MIKIKVSKKYNNKKIVNLILDTYPSLSSSTVFKTLRKKDILLNGKRIKENISVFENDEIIAYISDSLLFSNPKLDIVYDDENILIVNKPTEISVTADSYLDKTLTRTCTRNISRSYALPSS